METQDDFKVRTEAGKAVLSRAGYTLRLEFLEDGVVRIHQSLDDAPPRASFAVVFAPLIAAEPMVSREGEGVLIHTETAAVRVFRDGGFEVLDASGERRFAAPPTGDLRRVREGARAILESPEWERIHGLGEKTGHLDKRGQVLRMWNKDHWLYDRTSDPIYKSIPFWIGLRGALAQGVFVDDPGEVVLDFGATEAGFIRITVRREALDLWLIPGPTPEAVLNRYTALTGRPFLPPHWALGFHQCRYSYPTSQRVREVAASFRRKGIPCDAIWLDIHHMDAFKSFTVCPHSYGDLPALSAELSAQNFRLVAIADPGIKAEPGYEVFERLAEGDHLVRKANGEVAHYEVWPGDCVFPDFFQEKTRALWAELQRKALDSGIAGYWNDMNEPAVFGGPGKGTFEDSVLHQTAEGPRPHSEVHNAYGHMMARATFEGMGSARPFERPFVLTRAAYAGTQRYAATWSGDNDATWDDLRLSLTMALNMGMSGFPIYGPDLGGYAGAPSPELMTRWLQLGAFFGLMRIHAMFGTPDQEPWSFGHDAELRHKAAIEWRYRLLPLTTSLHYQATMSGMPPMRPLWTQWPEHEALSKREDLFLYGADLMVAPVLVEGQRLRSVPVPPGRWFSFPSGQPVPLNRSDVTLEGGLDAIPMLVRAGAFIPMTTPRASTLLPAPETLEILCFPGGSQRFELIEDDGLLPLGQARVRKILFESQALDGRFDLKVSAPTGASEQGAKTLELVVKALREVPSLQDGQGLLLSLGPVGSPVHWSAESKELRLRVPVASLPLAFRIQHGADLFPNPESKLLVRSADAGGSTIDLGGPAHRLAAVSWTPKRVQAHARLEWTQTALSLSVTVRDEAPGPACSNPQEDGLTIALLPLGQDGSARYLLQIPEEGGACMKLRGRGFIPTAEIAGESERDGGLTRYRLAIPAAAFGHAVLHAGLELPFDLGLQHSDRTGRRALVEWCHAFTRSWAAGGRLVLV